MFGFKDLSRILVVDAVPSAGMLTKFVLLPQDCKLSATQHSFL